MREVTHITHIETTSTWLNPEGKELKITGINYHEGNTTTFTFAGYNPLPCSEMESTFGVLAEWLYNAEWRMKQTVIIKYITDKYSDDGVLTFHGEKCKVKEVKNKYTAIPEEKAAEEKTFFVNVEANTKEEAAEVALKSPWHKLDCELCLNEFEFPICRECTKERK